MAGLNFDDVAPASQSKAISFDDVAPATQQQQQQTDENKAQFDLTGVGGKVPGARIDMAAALLEQPGALAWQFASSIASALHAAAATFIPEVKSEEGKAAVALGTTVGGAIVGAPGGMLGSLAAGSTLGAAVVGYTGHKPFPPGMPLGDRFMEEYNRSMENAASMYVPITEGGAALTKQIGEVFEWATSAFPDWQFEHTAFLPDEPRAFAAAFSKTALNAALLLLTPGAFKGGKAATKPGEVVKGHPATSGTAEPTYQEVWQNFKDKYPATASAFEASNVGKVRTEDFVKKDKTIFDAVDRKLNTELQLPEDKKNMTLEGKLRMMMQKTDPNIPVPEIDKAVRATLDGLTQLDQLRVARANDRGLPFIQDPAISKEPVVVTKGGVAMTPEQAAASDVAFKEMTTEERAGVLGMSAMGRRRLELERWQQAQRDGNTRAANAAKNQLERNWARDFPWRDPAKRASGLERFVNFGGRMTWEEAASNMGRPTRGYSKKEGGWIKEPGGMWDKDAVKKLAEPMKMALARGREDDIPPPDIVEDGTVPIYNQVDRMVQGYLNRYAGTKRDPLKDIILANGKRWEDITDAVIKGERVQGPKGKETQWSIPGQDITETGMVDANTSADAFYELRSHLSHVGDYLRQNVAIEKLKQYDLVRAVKETDAADKRAAKAMEKAQAASTKDLPVYKEYPDGFKWVELKLPEKLTPEQMKGVRAANKSELKSLIAGDEGPYGVHPTNLQLAQARGYVALDATGKPIQNSYTGELAGGSTPEEAWLAGRLAEEGNIMGHCVGGYCEPVASGETRIYSLRDLGGRSHVTIEVTPEGPWGNTVPELPSINQIKGKQNRAPLPEYLPYVQDFVKSGKWGNVHELENAGMVHLSTRHGSLYPEVYTHETAPDPTELTKRLGGPGYYTREEVHKAAVEMGAKEDPRHPWRIGRSQRGMIEVEGFPSPHEEVKKAVSSRPWSVGSQEQDRAQATKLEAAYNSNFAAEEEGIKVSFGEKANQLKRGIFGHNIDLKDALEKSGAYGEKARERMILQNAAMDTARFESDQVNQNIFIPLSAEEKVALDKLIRDRVIIEIKARDPGYKVPEGVDGQTAEAHARQMARTMGDDAFRKIEDKADAVFNVYRQELLRGFQAGLYDQATFDKLIHFDYEPTQYIDLIDPVQQFTVRGKTTSVRGSGIPFLGRGKTNAAVRMDSRALLFELIARNRNREFKNNTLQALWDLADTTPDNGIVSIQGKGETGKHPPSGWSALGLRIEGEQRQLLMKDEFAEQFVNEPQGMHYMVANAFRVASFSGSLRATAVGMNPIFPIAGIPMDIAHTWAAAGAEYSPHIPKYLAQIGTDMLEVIGDVKRKDGSYAQAMREGLGSHYMTAYGQEIFTRNKTIAEKMSPSYQRVKHVLQGFNQEADIWIRLAHRNRLIKMGLPSWEATARARDRLDYSESGILTRSVDTVWPWTSVAMEALYKAGKAGVRDPKDFAIKMAWVFGAYTAWDMANMVASPETWKHISTSDKLRGLDITYGDQLYVLDQDGNKRYFYTPLRFDQVFSPIQGTVVGALELAEYGRLPNNLISETINQTFNIWNPLDGVPIMGAAAAMMNFDPYTGKKIFQGTVKPQDETRPSTHPLFVTAGEFTGLSPERMQAASSKMASPWNPFIMAAGYGLRMLLGDSDYRAKARISDQILAENLRPIIKLTNPMSGMVDSLQEELEAEGSHRKKQTDAIDELVFGARHGSNSMKDVSTYISTQPQDDRERLHHRALVGYNIDQIMSHYQERTLSDVPPKAWWRATGAAPAKVRAQEFYNKWLSADPAGRQTMQGIAEALQTKGTGYLSEEFKRELAREKSLLGSENR